MSEFYRPIFALINIFVFSIIFSLLTLGLGCIQSEGKNYLILENDINNQQRCKESKQSAALHLVCSIKIFYVTHNIQCSVCLVTISFKDSKLVFTQECRCTVRRITNKLHFKVYYITIWTQYIHQSMTLPIDN